MPTALISWLLGKSRSDAVMAGNQLQFTHKNSVAMML